MRTKRQRDNSLIQKVSESLDLPDHSGTEHLRASLHESAHLIAAKVLGESIEGVGLGGPSSLGGAASWTRPCDRGAIALKNHMAVVWAGVLAEDREPLDGECDQNRLRELAIEIYGKAAKPARIDREIRRAKSKAARLVRRHRPEIEELAGHLLTLYGCLDRIKG
jgi:hypothetical protein